MSERISVVIVDLLCVSPYYDIELIKGLESAGVDAELAVTSFHLDSGVFERSGVRTLGCLSDRLAKFRIGNVFMRRVCRIAEYLVNLMYLERHLKRERAVVAHIQWLPLLDWVDIELRWLRRIRQQGIPIVLTVHNVLPHDNGTKRRESFGKLYRSVDRLICHTLAARQQLIDLFGVREESISVIPHGPVLVDEAMCSRKPKPTETEAAREDVCVLFLGRLKEYKGVEVLIDAWERVVIERAEARLVIAGNGSSSFMRSLRERVEALGDDARIALHLGPLTTSDVVRFHQEADIVVFPYQAITQSGAMMTAMAFEKAIIATDLPGFREYLGVDSRALLVPANDADALGRALVRLISDPNMRIELQLAVKEALVGELSWAAIGEQTCLCYRDLAASN